MWKDLATAVLIFVMIGIAIIVGSVIFEAFWEPYQESSEDKRDGQLEDPLQYYVTRIGFLLLIVIGGGIVYFTLKNGK